MLVFNKIKLVSVIFSVSIIVDNAIYHSIVMFCKGIVPEENISNAPHWNFLKVLYQRKIYHTLLIEISALDMKEHSNVLCSLVRKSPRPFFEYTSATPYLAPAPIYTHLPFQIAI